MLISPLKQTTTHTIDAAIQASNEPAWMMVERNGISNPSSTKPAWIRPDFWGLSESDQRVRLAWA